MGEHGRAVYHGHQLKLSPIKNPLIKDSSRPRSVAMIHRVYGGHEPAKPPISKMASIRGRGMACTEEGTEAGQGKRAGRGGVGGDVAEWDAAPHPRRCPVAAEPGWSGIIPHGAPNARHGPDIPWPRAPEAGHCGPALEPPLRMGAIAGTIEAISVIFTPTHREWTRGPVMTPHPRGEVKPCMAVNSHSILHIRAKSPIEPHVTHGAGWAGRLRPAAVLVTSSRC